MTLEHLPDFDSERDEYDVEVIEHQVTDNDRALSRRIALQVLYEVDSVKHAVGEVLARRIQAQEARRRVASYATTLVSGVLEHRQRLDDLIQRFAPEFPLEQVAIIDRNILRMAIYEFAILDSIPVGVAIDQAVELAGLFGAESTPRFVNGVLGSLSGDEAGVRHQLSSNDLEGKSGANGDV